MNMFVLQFFPHTGSECRDLATMMRRSGRADLVLALCTMRLCGLPRISSLAGKGWTDTDHAGKPIVWD